MEVIECNNVTKEYKHFPAIKNLSFSIRENTITGLIGRNGAGKTTLLKMIAGFYKPTVGELKVFNETPFNSLNVSANSIFIDDNISFPKGSTLAEIIKFTKHFYSDLNEEFSYKLLKYFSLDLNKKYIKLSKGMKSTFNSIVGISSHCALTLMDEPTIGMDAAVRKDIYKLILRDYIEHPRTIIISSHLLNELEEILENILLIDKGILCLHESLTDLKEYAVGFTGKTEAIDALTKNKEIIYEESFGVNSIYKVIKCTDFQKESSFARLAGIEANAISLSDLCIYLTDSKKGGINNVFKN